MPAKIYPLLTYHDAKKAIAFLQEAFGFEARAASKGDNIWSQSNGVTCVGMPEGIDAHYERARAAGAEIVREPFDTHYGARNYSVRDIEGNLWDFGTYVVE